MMDAMADARTCVAGDGPTADGGTTDAWTRWVVGWQVAFWLMLGIVPATVATMRDLGATELVAWVGPHICGGCYEVPAPMRDDVASSVGPHASKN